MHSVTGLVESPESFVSPEEALAILREADPSSALFRRVRNFFNDAVEVQPCVSRATPPQERRFLTIGMATHDDFDGCYFTILAIRLFHPEIWDDLEILVVDNNPSGPCGSALKDFEHWVPHYRYIPYDSRQSTASRDLVFREAAGHFVLCVDSHVFFPPGALSRFVDYCRAHPDSTDLLQGPLIGDDFLPHAACFKAVWSVGMYGQWEWDERAGDVDSPPFEILMQGLGVFGCRREAWPGFNPRLAGFGGEEGYIHEKIRRAGGRNLCLPFLRWLHRFERPMGVRYTLTNYDRVRNYLLIYDELGLDPAPVIDHFTGYLGKEHAQEAFDSVQAELRSPFHFFDTIYCLNLDRLPERWAVMEERFRALSINRAVRRFPAADTPVDPRIGHVLSHRRVIAQARAENLEHILMFEDNIHFSPDATRVLGAALEEIAGREWDVLFLGGYRLMGDPDPNAPVPGTHAMAFHRTGYDAILKALPGDAADAVLWLDRYPSLAEFYAVFNCSGPSAARRFFSASPIAVVACGNVACGKHAPATTEAQGPPGAAQTAASVTELQDTLTLEEALEILTEADPYSAMFRSCRDLLDAKLEVRHPIPPATKRGDEKFFTIGAAVHDDYDGLYFTIQAIRLYHPEILDHVEFLVIDNNPAGPCAQPLKNLESWIPNYRYFPYPWRQSTAVRDLIFREAAGEFVLCIDCHVFFPAGALADLINYCWQHRDTGHLLQGPLLWDDLNLSTHFDPVWREGQLFHGCWGLDSRGNDAEAPPFEIGMMGLGAFACRRGAWPGLNPRLNGFGGEEGYLHEKFRRKGARCLCLPFFRWTHRFPRPMGVPYPLTFEDRARNYLITHYELGWDPGPVIRHLEKCVGEEKSRALIEPVQAETSSPFHVFDEAWCINVNSRTDRWEAARRRFQKLGIATKVSRFAAAETPLNHHIGCALSHRRIIEDARRRDLESVLVFEDDVVFTSDTAEVLRLALVELRDLDWQILYLGGCRWEPPVPIPGHKHLVLPQATTCTQSLVYHRSVYGRILEAVPDNAVDVAFWLRDTQAIDQFYAFGLDASLYLVEPVIASQPNLFGRETRIFDK